MKICQIMAGDEEGGLENHFVELSNGLLQHVDEVVAIGHAKYRDRFLPGVRFIPLDLSRGRRNPLLLFKLARILRQEAPDLIHAQANKAVEMLARIRHFVPGYRLGTIHNRKKSIGMFASMQTVIGVSKGVIANLQHPDLRVVYNGMKPYGGRVYGKTDLVAKFSLNPDLPVCLAVGRLVPTKAFDNLINAWSGELGQLLIVGEGPEQENLEQLIAQRNLDGKVVLAGFCPDVRGMMAGSDLLVFASHREGFSYALAEALLCRLPVLSTKVPGAVEVLPDDYLVEVDDVPALSAALQRVLANPFQAKIDQALLFSWAQEELTVEHMVEATAAIYQDVMAKELGRS